MTLAPAYRRISQRLQEPLRRIRELSQKPTLDRNDTAEMKKNLAMVRQGIVGFLNERMQRNPVRRKTTRDSYLNWFRKYFGHPAPYMPKETAETATIDWKCNANTQAFIELLGGCGIRITAQLMPGHIVPIIRTNSGKEYMADTRGIFVKQSYERRLLEATKSINKNGTCNTPIERDAKRFKLPGSPQPRQYMKNHFIDLGIKGAVATAHLHLGLGYLKEENFGKSLSHLKEAIRICPNHLTAKIALASAYRLMKEYHEADSTITNLVAEHSDSPEAHLELALLRHHQGRPEDARRAGNKAHALNRMVWYDSQYRIVTERSPP